MRKENALKKTQFLTLIVHPPPSTEPFSAHESRLNPSKINNSIPRNLLHNHLPYSPSTILFQKCRSRAHKRRQHDLTSPLTWATDRRCCFAFLAAVGLFPPDSGAVGPSVSLISWIWSGGGVCPHLNPPSDPLCGGDASVRWRRGLVEAHLRLVTYVASYRSDAAPLEVFFSASRPLLSQIWRCAILPEAFHGAKDDLGLLAFASAGKWKIWNKSWSPQHELGAHLLPKIGCAHSFSLFSLFWYVCVVNFCPVVPELDCLDLIPQPLNNGADFNSYPIIRNSTFDYDNLILYTKTTINSVIHDFDWLCMCPLLPYHEKFHLIFLICQLDFNDIDFCYPKLRIGALFDILHIIFLNLYTLSMFVGTPHCSMMSNNLDDFEWGCIPHLLHHLRTIQNICMICFPHHMCMEFGCPKALSSFASFCPVVRHCLHEQQNFDNRSVVSRFNYLLELIFWTTTPKHINKELKDKVYAEFWLMNNHQLNKLLRSSYSMNNYCQILLSLWLMPVTSSPLNTFKLLFKCTKCPRKIDTQDHIWILPSSVRAYGSYLLHKYSLIRKKKRKRLD